MFYGVPGGLSGAQWGTQDANGVWSGWANGAAQPQAAYDPGTGAAFGGAADAYTGGGANAYMAGLPGDFNQGTGDIGGSVASFGNAAPAAATFGGAPAGGASFGGAAPTMQTQGSLNWGSSSGVPSLGDTFAGGSSTVNPMTGGAPDMGGFLRGLDWSPQNAGNSTRQMTDAMAKYGWTSDQVGQNLGFTAQQMNDHIAKYGAPTAGAPGGQFASGAGGPGMSGYGSMPQNPYLPGIAGDITRRTTDMMNAGIKNARGAGIMAGGFGGSAQGIMEGKAISGATDNLAGQLGNLYGSAWNQDQSRDLQRYGMDQNFYQGQRGQDLQQLGIGASLLGSGLGMEWLPVQNASGVTSGYTGLGSTTTPGSGGGWQGLLGGALGASQFAQNMGWFK